MYMILVNKYFKYLYKTIYMEQNMPHVTYNFYFNYFYNFYKYILL